VIDNDVNDPGQCEYEEHCSVLRIAKVPEMATLKCSEDLESQTNCCEEDLENAFNLPASSATTEAITLEGGGRFERHPTLAKGSIVTSVGLHCPPEGKDNEEGAGEGVTSK